MKNPTALPRAIRSAKIACFVRAFQVIIIHAVLNHRPISSDKLVADPGIASLQ